LNKLMFALRVTAIAKACREHKATVQLID
jgi:hypothetical protein